MAAGSKGTATRSAPGNKKAPAKVAAKRAPASHKPPVSKKKAVIVVKKAATATKKPAAAAKTSAAKKSTSSKKAATTKKAPTGVAAAPGAKTAARRASKSPATPRTATVKKATTRVAHNGAGARPSGFGPGPKAAAVRPKTGPYAKDTKFLDEVRDLLQADRTIYQEQATSLRAEADSLALEREPGDVQFDEESGEGGTVTVDRERNLALSGQATLAVEEIDDALARIADKSYGSCERCFQPIPKPRLRALPHARLCVACKAGGLSRR